MWALVGFLWVCFAAFLIVRQLDAHEKQLRAIEQQIGRAVELLADIKDGRSRSL